MITLAAAVAPASAAALTGGGASVDAAIAACEQWLLTPATWTEGIDAFPQSSGLASRGLEPQASVPDVALPPPPLRRAMHHWRVRIGAGGVFVTTSDQQPICHLAGGSPENLAPVIAAALGSRTLLSRWQPKRTGKRGELQTTTYISRIDPNLTMIVTRAAGTRARTDRIQFLATAQYKIGK